jgi:hypothetical protein
MSAKDPEITKEEQELLQILDEELALPPLPLDFVSNVLARLEIPSDAPLIEDDTELAISAPSSDTLEELFQRGLDALKRRDFKYAVKQFFLAADQGHMLSQCLICTLIRMERGYTEAVEGLRLAAGLNDIYKRGLLDMPKDYDEVEKLFHLCCKWFAMKYGYPLPASSENLLMDLLYLCDYKHRA